MKITQFSIDDTKKSLTIHFMNGEAVPLSFEYLRVLSPSITATKAQSSIVAHKKRVVLTAIENVGKHGFRLLFNDEHYAIYSEEYLILLSQEFQPRWHNYIAELKASGQSREEMINITQL
ncbi:MAG: gamma-butyrobetaine hydroxylase-like domain-containing protein [Colwellia sp.]